MQLYEYIGWKFAIFNVYNRLSGIKAGRISPVLIPLNLVWYGVVSVFNWGWEDASGTDHVRCGGGVCLSLPSPVEGCREGGIRPEWIAAGTVCTLWSAHQC